jgi:hypothetical protein
MTELSDDKDNYINFIETRLKSKNKLLVKSKTRATLKLNNEFKEHSKVVDRLNELDMGWKAFNYDQFSSLTLLEINKFSGRSNSRSMSGSDMSNKHKHEKICENGPKSSDSMGNFLKRGSGESIRVSNGESTGESTGELNGVSYGVSNGASNGLSNGVST